MQDYERKLQRELKYFDKIIELVKAQLEKKTQAGAHSRERLISDRREMWDDVAHASEDFDSAIEMSRYLAELNIRTASYLAQTGEIQKLESMLDSPYFARVDFSESADGEGEKIYIGRSSLIDDDTHEIHVYDWRSPIAGIFYRYELGEVQYQAPGGTISGFVSLKRQYEIRRGKFEYFFDANVQIVDEYLRRLLSKNASSKMTDIVETIQRDQDVIIRDSKNELLMVQGAAGSGKTSVALHRVAYLMYQGLSSKLSANHIVILSPSALFAKYISNVLPELGEDNVKTLSFEEICENVLEGELEAPQTRNLFFEELITCESSEKRGLLKAGMEFKASGVFVTMLERLATCCERKLIPFCDVVYNQKMLFSRDQLKAKLLARSIQIPAAVRLKQIEAMILQEVREERKSRLAALEQFTKNCPDRVFESKAFARMLSIRENKRLLARIHSFTNIDYSAVYRRLFCDKDLFYSLAKGLELPQSVEEIRRQTDERLSRRCPRYEDMLALTFLKVKLAGCDSYKGIRQVVIDEAQDYYPIHFEILGMLFPKAKYTVLGDVNQTIEKETTLAFYESVEHILKRGSSALLKLSKSFRCTNQIIAFSEKFIDTPAGLECFSRDGEPPEVICATDRRDMDARLIEFYSLMKAQGYKSVCILCKSLKESAALYDRLKEAVNVTLMDGICDPELDGLMIAPIYMAKGLEFDAVLVYGVDDDNYRTADDKKLLYIASTRALHRLALLYRGQKSRILSEKEEEADRDN